MVYNLAKMASTDFSEFSRQLGARLREARRRQELTQVQVSEELGISQQVLASYEGGRVKVPVALLPEFSQLLGTSVDSLLGIEAGSGKRGPTPRLLSQVEKVSQLSRAKQQFVVQMLEGFLRQEEETAKAS